MIVYQSNLIHAHYFFSCTKCNSKACISCVKALQNELEINGDHHNDDWYKRLKDSITNNKQPPSFIGHCCEIRIKIQESIEIQNKHTPKSANVKLLHYDGYLHLPELSILIPPSIVSNVDIHGFGKEPSSALPGLLHGVIDNICAEECYNLNIIPDGSSCNELPQLLREVNYVNLKNKRVLCKCFIQTFIMDVTLNTDQYQHHAVTKEHIGKSQLLKPPSSEFIWAILAKEVYTSINYHLVNIRWPCSTSMIEWTSKQSEKLYKDTIQLVDRDGLDATRKSGSNGTTTYLNYNILRWLKTEKAFIRKGKGVKLVEKKRKLGDAII